MYTDLAACLVAIIKADAAGTTLSSSGVTTLPAQTVNITVNGSSAPLSLGESKIKVTSSGSQSVVYFSTSWTYAYLSSSPTRLLVKILVNGTDTVIWAECPDVSPAFTSKAHANLTDNSYACYIPTYEDVYNNCSAPESWTSLSTSGTVATLTQRFSSNSGDFIVYGDGTRAVIEKLGQSPGYIVADANTDSSSLSPTDSTFFGNAPAAPSSGDGGWAGLASSISSLNSLDGTVSAAMSDLATALGITL